MNRTLYTALAGCCLLLGLTACSSSAAKSAAPSGLPTVAAASPAAGASAAWPKAVADSGLAKGLVLPLEAYMEPYPEQVAIGRARMKLVVSCMARYGFTYSIPTSNNPPPNFDDANMDRRYGISDPGDAAKYGYELPGGTQSPAPSQPMSAAEEMVFIGKTGPGPHDPAASNYKGSAIPAGGCVGEAQRKLGAANLNTQLPDTLDEDSLTRSQADPAVQSALHAWSACMKTKGYTVDTPFNASSLAGGGTGSGPTSEEINVAVADVACKAQTKLVHVWFTSESAIQQQQIEQNQLALSQLRQQIDAAVKAATALTGS